MVDLTDLITWQAEPEPPLPPSSGKTFHIFNDCWWSVTNGGCCLSWTVPTGTRNIKSVDPFGPSLFAEICFMLALLG